MAEFRLQIVTPGGLEFDDNVENLIVRAVNGDVGILARHADYVVPLEIGTARVKKTAECASARATAVRSALPTAMRKLLRSALSGRTKSTLTVRSTRKNAPRMP